MTRARFGRRHGRPLVLGHRGAAALAPENTIAGLQAARAAGADGVEIDVRPSREGVAVVFHDRTLARLAGRAEAVARLPVDELRRVRVRGEPIPTLDELLAAADGLLVNIEIKDDTLAGDARFAAHVAGVVRRHGAEARVLVSSFQPCTLWRLRAVAPELPTGLLVEKRRRWRSPRALLAGGWARRLVRPFAVHPEAALCDALRLGRWQREGYTVVAWTVDDANEARRLARLGVDGLIANDPGRVRHAIDDVAVPDDVPDDVAVP